MAQVHVHPCTGSTPVEIFCYLPLVQICMTARISTLQFACYVTHCRPWNSLCNFLHRHFPVSYLLIYPFSKSSLSANQFFHSVTAHKQPTTTTQNPFQLQLVLHLLCILLQAGACCCSLFFGFGSYKPLFCFF